MNTRHPDRQPETRDELDDVLDDLLQEAGRDLQSSIERVLDVDRSLGAVLGSDAPTNASPHTTPQSGSRATRPAWGRAGWSWGMSTRAKNTLGRARYGKRVSVERRIENLREMIGKLSKLPVKLNPKMDYGLDDLHELQNALAKRRLSRTSADQLIERIEHKLRSAITPDFHRSAWTRMLSWLAVAASAAWCFRRRRRHGWVRHHTPTSRPGYRSSAMRRVWYRSPGARGSAGPGRDRTVDQDH